MTSVRITWANLPDERKLFVVYHSQLPKNIAHGPDDCLVVPDRWGNGPREGERCLMTESERRVWNFNGEGIAVSELPKLDDGDIVLYEAAHGRLEIVFQVASTTNSLYVTNACNSRCQFCPQPSTNDDGRLYQDANRIIDLVGCPGATVNITGGEPTIDRSRFVGLLEHAAQKWSETKAFVLTNGRNLRDGDFVSDIFSARGGSPVGFGVPLYADSAVVHDAVVGVAGAFGQTVRGLYNLAVHHPEIELRFVMSKITYRRLPNLVEFIGKSIPFATRLAVMGLEPMGYCRTHWNDFWIDPEDCSETLLHAAEMADNYGINMMLYNFQLCCLPAELRELSCSTISEWKRVYHERCLMCPARSACGGFFASQNADKFRPRRFYGMR